jgi:hypothetical protein
MKKIKYDVLNMYPVYVKELYEVENHLRFGIRQNQVELEEIILVVHITQ